MNIALADCGAGNLHSAEAGLRRAGATVRITSAAADIDAADKVVLPGDGHFASCMREIDARGLRAPLLRAAEQKPFLGICIGMQVLYEGSDEDPDTPGLGILRGRVRKFPETEKIPHIGWNTASAARPHPAFRGIAADARFYFIHSYYCPPDADAIAVSYYGETFAAAAAKGGIVAAQFHPEKSARPGAQLLRNFVAD
ncbi:MAG: imidazole glycerol phosphate synthase subunit HisH [Gammaproteobacteria bacterium]